MNVHPVLARLSDAGFAVVPVLNMHGGDTGLVAFRRDPREMVVVTAWSDDSAFGAHVPHGRDWARPFVPTVEVRNGPAPFAEMVARMLSPRHWLVTDAKAIDRALSVEGAR